MPNRNERIVPHKKQEIERQGSRTCIFGEELPEGKKIPSAQR
jgi:hypothetical protein